MLSMQAATAFGATNVSIGDRAVGRWSLAAPEQPAPNSGVKAARSRVISGWIVSPLFDILFFANCYWVLAFFPFFVSADGEPYVQFWMAYFLATPHRWLTLVIAATDRDRRYGQTWLFAAIAVGFAVAGWCDVMGHRGFPLPVSLLHSISWLAFRRPASIHSENLFREVDSRRALDGRLATDAVHHVHQHPPGGIRGTDISLVLDRWTPMDRRGNARDSGGDDRLRAGQFDALSSPQAPVYG